MMQFKNFFTHEHGTYACLKPLQANAMQLYQWLCFRGIDNLDLPEKYHCTVIYSKKPCPAMTFATCELPIIVKAKEWKLFGEVLVLAIDAPEAAAQHNRLMTEFDASYDYKTYIPHITVAKTSMVPSELPEFSITFNSWHVSPLDPNR
jgi:hypothetical protein